MCFPINQHSLSMKHLFISLYFKYQSFMFTCFLSMNSPVYPSLDVIYCTCVRGCGVWKGVVLPLSTRPRRYCKLALLVFMCVLAHPQEVMSVHSLVDWSVRHAIVKLSKKCWIWLHSLLLLLLVSFHIHFYSVHLFGHSFINSKPSLTYSSHFVIHGIYIYKEIILQIFCHSGLRLCAARRETVGKNIQLRHSPSLRSRGSNSAS